MSIEKTAKKKFMSRTKKRNLFFGCLIAPLLLQFSIFYVIVALKSFSMAFLRYESLGDGQVGYQTLFAGLDNFKKIFTYLGTNDNWKMLTNSLLVYGLKLIVVMCGSILFSYYIYKRFALSGLFRVILFLPNIISGMVLVLLFRYLVDDGIKALFHLKQGLISNPETRFGTVVFYGLWVGFGLQTLMFSTSMSGINDSVVESAQLDGVNTFQELFYITIPMIFPTIITFIVVGLAACFTDQLSLFTFYGRNVPYEMRTTGYFLYLEALDSGLMPERPWSELVPTGHLNYPEITAFGMMISLVMVPTTFFIKRALEKYGPRVD